jgi:hypothetical protein
MIKYIEKYLCGEFMKKKFLTPNNTYKLREVL